MSSTDRLALLQRTQQQRLDAINEDVGLMQSIPGTDWQVAQATMLADHRLLCEMELKLLHQELRLESDRARHRAAIEEQIRRIQEQKIERELSMRRREG